MSEMVEVKTQLESIKDDLTDNIFLALAIDGQANVIVSGDHHLLDLRAFRGLPIIRIRRFLKL